MGGGEIIMSHGNPNSRGVSILFKKGADCIIHSKILDPVGRFVILKAEIKRQNICIDQHLCTE